MTKKEVNIAIDWWMNRLEICCPDDEPISLFSFAENQEIDDEIEIRDRLTQFIKECIKRATWRPKYPSFGTKIRCFGTHPKLAEHRNITKTVLSEEQNLGGTGWPKNTVMHIDPGRVYIKDDNGTTSILR